MRDFFIEQSKETYERSHNPRFDYLAERFSFDKIVGKTILDVGCGLGFLFDRMNLSQNYCVGIDNTSIVSDDINWKYIKSDLNFPFADKVDSQFDLVFCLETLEHLTNPYNCLYEIKKLIARDGQLILSIPAESVQHNTIYPDQFFPVENFKKFLGQLAFNILHHETHDASFKQEVFILSSLSWENNMKRMRFPNSDPRQQNVPPHEAINL